MVDSSVRENRETLKEEDLSILPLDLSETIQLHV